MWGLGPLAFIAAGLYIAYDTFNANRPATRTEYVYWFSKSGFCYEGKGAKISLIPASRFSSTPPFLAKLATDKDHIVVLGDQNSGLDLFPGSSGDVALTGGETTGSQWDVTALVGNRVLLRPHKVEASIDTTPPAPTWASLSDGALTQADGVASACRDRSGSTFILTTSGITYGDGTQARFPVPKNVTSFAADRQSKLAAVVADGTAYALQGGNLVPLKTPWEFFGSLNQVNAVAIAGHDRQIWVSVNHPGNDGAMVLAFSGDGVYQGKVITVPEHMEPAFGAVGDSCPPSAVLDQIKTGG